jgi:predicted aspartyl protease
LSDVTINDDKYTFLIDTGAGKSLISSAIAEKHKFKLESKYKVAIASGVHSIKNTTLSKINIGGVSINYAKPMDVLVYDIKRMSEDMGMKVDGIIGMDILYQTQLVVNLTKKLYFLEFNQGKHQVYDVSQGIPFDYHINTNQININNSPVSNLLIDTGANISHMSSSNLSKLGKANAVEPAKVGTLDSVNEEIMEYSFKKLNINGHVIQDVSFIKDDKNILGTNILSKFDFVFDFPNRQMYLKSRNENE